MVLGRNSAETESKWFAPSGKRIERRRWKHVNKNIHREGNRDDKRGVINRRSEKQGWPGIWISLNK